jgi:hypothetical protein
MLRPPNQAADPCRSGGTCSQVQAVHYITAGCTLHYEPLHLTSHHCTREPLHLATSRCTSPRAAAPHHEPLHLATSRCTSPWLCSSHGVPRCRGSRVHGCLQVPPLELYSYNSSHECTAACRCRASARWRRGRSTRCCSTPTAGLRLGRGPAHPAPLRAAPCMRAAGPNAFARHTHHVGTLDGHAPICSSTLRLTGSRACSGVCRGISHSAHAPDCLLLACQG